MDAEEPSKLRFELIKGHLGGGEERQTRGYSETETVTNIYQVIRRQFGDEPGECFGFVSEPT